MRVKKHDQENTVGTKKRAPLGFCCAECGQWFPRTKRVIVNETWFCRAHGQEVQAEFDRSLDRTIREDD